MEMEEGAVEKGRIIFISNNWAVYQMKLGEGILSIIIVCERERERAIIIPNCNNHEMQM